MVICDSRALKSLVSTSRDGDALLDGFGEAETEAGIERVVGMMQGMISGVEGVAKGLSDVDPAPPELADVQASPTPPSASSPERFASALNEMGPDATTVWAGWWPSILLSGE